MAASLTYCPACPAGKKENKRISLKERRIYHKLLRRISKQIVCEQHRELAPPNEKKGKE